MPCGAIQDGQVKLESSDKMGSTGEEIGKPLQYSCLENPWTVLKGKNIWHWKKSFPCGEALKSAKTTVAQIMNSLLQNSDLKKERKTTRLLRYELNQIPHNYTVEVTNRFKGLDLIECLKNYGQRFLTLYRRQWSRPSPRKRNAQRQNGCLRRPYK